MDDIIFTSYCFDNRAAVGDYYAQQVRLKETILNIYPNANLLFEHDPEEIGKPIMQQAMYGFKVRLVKQCIERGFNKIIFFDTPMTLVKPVDYYFELVKQYGVLSIKDSNTLDKYISDKALKYCNKTREQVNSWYLTGGSIYVFDFNLRQCNDIFTLWSQMKDDGIFGSQKEQIEMKDQRHRHDEACMALALYINGSQPVSWDDMRYAAENPETKIRRGMENHIILKKHFK